MNQLTISPRLSLPANAMTLTSAVLGIRGSGKTNTGVVFTEELLAQQQQVIIIDPLDVWWGLKSSADGKAPGFPIVLLGGEHGDLPLASGDGGVLADFLVNSRASAILALRHLRKGEQRKLVADFAEQLYQAKGRSGRNTPLFVVFDEASSFVPQSVQGDVARMVGAVEDLVRRGRASGIGVMLIDQRAASVNKDVLTQLELLVAHRHVSPQDQGALKAWVQAHDTGDQAAAFLSSLASLPQGEAWFWSPGWLNIFERVQVRKRHTFDSSATPQLGQVPSVPQAQAEVDLDALRERLSATLEQAAQSDPKYLKARVAELERELRERPTPEPIVEVREVPVVSPEQEAHFEEMAHSLIVMSKDLHNLGSEILQSVKRAREAVEEPPPPAPEQAPPKSKSVPKADATVAPQSRPLPRVDISPPQQRILNALADFEALGLRQVERSNVAIWSEQSPKSSAFGVNLKYLRDSGLIEAAGGVVALTEAGRKAARPSARPATRRELHQAWLDRLPAAQARILIVLLEAHPHSLHREGVASRAGQSNTSSAFGVNLKALKTLGLVEYPGPGYVAATWLLFPEGLS